MNIHDQRILYVHIYLLIIALFDVTKDQTDSSGTGKLLCM